MIITQDGSGRVLVAPPDFKSGVLAVEVGWWVRFPCASAIFTFKINRLYFYEQSDAIRYHKIVMKKLNRISLFNET